MAITRSLGRISAKIEPTAVVSVELPVPPLPTSTAIL
ncbi:Uncharacterised protein [Mycobacteroides abscessus subsp. abscessus]|nr:Uncharacterised protein [Mycobacteroides abscessus subsp. abscessus]